MDSATAAQYPARRKSCSPSREKARISKDRVNQFHRALIRHVLEAVQPFSTLECPWFKLNH